MAITDGLLSWWNCNEITGNTIYDTINNVDGTIEDTTHTTHVAGKIYNGLDFDGAEYGVQLGNNYDFEKNESWTWSFWLKQDNAALLDTDCAIIICESHQPSFTERWGYVFYLSSTDRKNISVYLYHNASPSTFRMIEAGTYEYITGNTWHNVIITYNGNSSYTGLKIYIDNVDRTAYGGNTGTLDTIVNGTNNTLRFNDYNYDGKLDEIGVWDRVLTSGERSQIWNNGSGMTIVTLPIITTNVVTNITSSGATGGGNVLNNGGDTITSRGICWDTSTNPTTGDTYSTTTGTTGSFSINITGLTDSTTYYVRAFAINSKGIAYGDNQSFTTESLPSPTLVTGLTYTNSTCTGFDLQWGYSGVI